MVILCACYGVASSKGLSPRTYGTRFVLVFAARCSSLSPQAITRPWTDLRAHCGRDTVPRCGRLSVSLIQLGAKVCKERRKQHK